MPETVRLECSVLCVCMVMTPVFGEFGMPGTFYTHTHSHMHLMRCRVQMQKETQQGHKCTGIRKLHQRAHGNGNRELPD